MNIYIYYFLSPMVLHDYNHIITKHANNVNILYAKMKKCDKYNCISFKGKNKIKRIRMY